MRRTVYFAVDAIWSFVVASIVWYCALVNMSFDFYGNSDDTLAGIIMVAGLVLYVVLTIAYIVFGSKRVRGWHWWMGIVAVIVSVAMAFAGTFGAVYGSELISGNLGV